MVCVRTVTHLTPAEQLAVLDFLHRAHTQHGAQLDDHLRLDLANGPRPGFLAAIATGQHDDDGDAVVGYAQASVGNDGVVIDGIAADAALRHRLLHAVVEQLPSDVAVTWWAEPAATDIAATLGMHPDRVLLRMRCPLPTTSTTDVAVRPFVPGRDEAQWLDVNNAAFRWHGEQGGWDMATLQQREHEPWFRPEGFLLHERAGRLAAFCWTKLHHEAELVGEIYVIAVHPDFHGLGLGRSLTVAGLQHMHQAGATTAMLYVDATNTGAVRLYESLGFTVAHTAQSFRRQPPGDSR